MTKLNFLKIPLGLFRSANRRELINSLIFYFKIREFSENLRLPKENFLTAFSLKMGISKSVLYKNMKKIKFLYSQTDSEYILVDWEETFILCGLKPSFIDQYFYLPILQSSKDIQTIWIYLELYYSFRNKGWDELKETNNLIEVSNGSISIDLLGYSSERNGGKIKELLVNLKLIKVRENNKGADFISFTLHPKSIIKNFFCLELKENIVKAISDSSIDILDNIFIKEKFFKKQIEVFYEVPKEMSFEEIIIILKEKINSS